MSMTREEAIKRIQHHMVVHHIGEPPHIYIKEALDMAIDALREQEEREKPPLTIGDQVRRMNDESMAWQFASLLVGGAGGVMEGIGITPNVDQMMAMAYPKMMDEVKKPVTPKEDPHG